MIPMVVIGLIATFLGFGAMLLANGPNFGGFVVMCAGLLITAIGVILGIFGIV